MQHKARMFAAILGGSAAVTLGALSATLIEGASAPASAKTPQMTLGNTSTQTTPSNAPGVKKAEPAIKGPAHK